MNPVTLRQLYGRIARPSFTFGFYVGRRSIWFCLLSRNRRPFRSDIRSNYPRCYQSRLALSDSENLAEQFAEIDVVICDRIGIRLDQASCWLGTSADEMLAQPMSRAPEPVITK